MTREARRLAMVLGLPSLGLAACLGVLSTYLPVLAKTFTSSTAVVGGLVGGEGFVAVLLPIWIGRWSDRTSTRYGRRLPFLFVAAPIGALALVLLPFAPALWVLSLEVLLFYLAYFTYFSPYRALYPDLVEPRAAARAQGIQGVFNGLGLGIALVGGGLLLEVWRPLPYIVAGSLLVVTTIALPIGLGRNALVDERAAPSLSSPSSELFPLVRGKTGRAVRDFVIANALLTLGSSGLKSFVVLWLTEGLHKSMLFTSGAMVVVAVGTVVGALVAGRLGDRHGPGPVLVVALTIFGGGMLVGAFTTSLPILMIAFPAIALSAGATLSLPYALLMRLAPSSRNGIVAGLFDASNGVGTILGPTLTGIAIDVLRPYFPAGGYAAMWPVLSLAVLASAAILRRYMRHA